MGGAVEAGVSYLPVFAAVAVVNVLGWLSPGPNMLIVASAALTRGTRAGVVTGLGVATGGLLWAALAVSGVGLVFETLPALFLALKIAGGLYLIWMGWRMWTAPGGPMPKAGEGGGFLTGLAVNLTNPKAVLFFGAVLAATIPPEAPIWLLVAVVVASQVQAALQHALSAWLFGSRAAGAVFGRLGRWSNRLFGGVMAALGLGLIWHAVRRG